MAVSSFAAAAQVDDPDVGELTSSGLQQQVDPAPEPPNYVDRIPVFYRETMPPVGAEWSPEAFIVWLYDRCSGRFARSNVFLKQNIYQERI